MKISNRIIFLAILLCSAQSQASFVTLVTKAPIFAWSLLGKLGRYIGGFEPATREDAKLMIQSMSRLEGRQIALKEMVEQMAADRIAQHKILAEKLNNSTASATEARNQCLIQSRNTKANLEILKKEVDDNHKKQMADILSKTEELQKYVDQEIKSYNDKKFLQLRLKKRMLSKELEYDWSESGRILKQHYKGEFAKVTKNMEAQKNKLAVFLKTQCSKAFEELVTQNSKIKNCSESQNQKYDKFDERVDSVFNKIYKLCPQIGINQEQIGLTD